MKAELVSPTKLKILLETGDMTRYGLSFEELDYARPETRKVFREVLELARRDTGFESSGCRLFVEAFPEKDSACSLIVTKLPWVSDSDVLTRLLRGRNASPDGAQLSFHKSRGTYLYRFDGFDQVADAASAVQELIGLSMDTRLIRQGKYYYLMLTLPRLHPYERSICSILSEYGTETESTELGNARLLEHGSLLIQQNAIQTLGRKRSMSQKRLPVSR